MLFVTILYVSGMIDFYFQMRACGDDGFPARLATALLFRPTIKTAMDQAKRPADTIGTAALGLPRIGRQTKSASLAAILAFFAQNDYYIKLICQCMRLPKNSIRP